MYNITAAMPGFAAETVTVEVLEGGEGVFLEFFLALDGGLAQWGLGRKFGPFGLLGGDAEGEEASEGGGQVCSAQAVEHDACRHACMHACMHLHQLQQVSCG